MNIDTARYGNVGVMQDRDNLYVTINGRTKRFGRYAQEKVKELLARYDSGEKAFTEVFNKLPKE